MGPAARGDLLKSQIFATGRNIHGFDPFRMPSAFATLEELGKLIKFYKSCLRLGLNTRNNRCGFVGNGQLKTEGSQ